MPRLESDFQSLFQDEVLTLFPEALILKLDNRYLQGVPDRLILNWDRWATLEFKRDALAKVQPNQPHYVELMNRMSYSSFVYPENAEAKLRELERALRPR